MARSKKQNEKAAERQELKSLTSITITVEASESTLQRLWALMMYAEAPFVPTYAGGPMPWEDPATAPARELQIDYEAVRRSIVKQLDQYLQTYTADRARSLLRSFGGEKVTKIPEERLLDLLAALETANE